MAKVAVVFWSASGNTEAMANSVAEGAKNKGAEVDVITAGDFSADAVANYDAFAFGCPAMGDEILEEDEFQPMWDEVSGSLEGKPVVLFGSYDWGDGQWMRTWEEEAPCAIKDTYICVLTPDDEAEAACVALGEQLV